MDTAGTGKQPVELVIPASRKDLNKLPYVLASVRRHLDVQSIHLITPDPNLIAELSNQRTHIHADSDILPYDKSRLRFRPNWMFQQWLKLFQDVTTTDWFLVTDADIVFNHDIPLWDGGHPILYTRRDPVVDQYHQYNRAILGFHKATDISLVSECTFYNKVLIQDMLAFTGMSRDQLWERTVEIVDESCFSAESELYGTYILHERPGIYVTRTLISALGGRYRNADWSKQEIEAEIAAKKRNNSNADIFSLHSWGSE